MKERHAGMAMAGLIAALLTVGCASPGIVHAYKGAEQKPNKLAVIQGSTNEPYSVLRAPKERISITHVDGDRTIPWFSMTAYPTAVYVQAGKHKLDVQYEHIHGVANGPIWVDATAKRTYQIKVMNPEERTERVYFVIEDVTAQTLVGGAEEQTEEPQTP